MFRIVTLNHQQDLRRWTVRRAFIAEQLAALRPDVVALNEVSVPQRSAHWIRDALAARTGGRYGLVQQTRTGMLSELEAEALITRFPIRETGNLDYRARDHVALCARLEIGPHSVDVFVTHLYASRTEDDLRSHQVRRLLDWIDRRDRADALIVCGDFNATLDQPSAALMAQRLRPTQTQPTAFTPLADPGGEPTYADCPRLDRCIDYIWVSERVRVLASRICVDRPSADDPTLWPSDHVGVYAELELAD